MTPGEKYTFQFRTRALQAFLQANPLKLFSSTVLASRNSSLAETKKCQPTRRQQRSTLCMRERSFWVLPQDQLSVTTALEANLSNFLFTNAQLYKQCQSLARFDSVCVEPDGVTFPGGRLSQVSSPDDLNTLMHCTHRDEILIVDFTDWKLIPAENLIAAFQNSATTLFIIVHDASQAKEMFAMLEYGVDGCVLQSSDRQQLLAFAALREQMATQNLLDNFSVATVSRITSVGIGERVCVDTCSMLTEDEGLLVGSSSQAMFLILSEAAAVQYVPSRPFRVNAGPVHSYCLVPGGKSKYLCELRAGDEVLVVSNRTRSSRTAVVGRVKIETRPLICIEAIADGEDSSPATVFLQNAETVRVATMDSQEEPTMTSVSALAIGDRMLLKTDSKARHIGIAIDEKIVER